MDNKSISMRLKDFFVKQCETPIVGSRIKESIEAVREMINESRNGGAGDQSNAESNSPFVRPVGNPDQQPSN